MLIRCQVFKCQKLATLYYWSLVCSQEFKFTLLQFYNSQIKTDLVQDQSHPHELGRIIVYVCDGPNDFNIMNITWRRPLESTMQKV